MGAYGMPNMWAQRFNDPRLIPQRPIAPIVRPNPVPVQPQPVAPVNPPQFGGQPAGVANPITPSGAQPPAALPPPNGTPAQPISAYPVQPQAPGVANAYAQRFMPQRQPYPLQAQ
jgi:hypothetical protein